MRSRTMKSMAKIVMLIGVLLLVLASLISPCVAAQEGSVSIIDMDDKFGDGYKRKVSANGNSSYHWTLFNDDLKNFTYDVTIEIDNSNTKWTYHLDPAVPITLAPGDTESVSLTVFAPNRNEGSTVCTVTFTTLRNGNEIDREQRSTFTSLEPIEKEQKVLGWFENPLPAPLDNIWGIFLLTILFWLGVSVLLVFIMDPCVKAVTKKTKTEIDDIILRIIRTPILVLVFFYGVVSSLRILDKQIPKVLIDGLNNLYGMIVVLVIFYLAYKLFKDILIYYGKVIAQKTSSNIDDVIIPIVEKIGVVVIALVALGYLLGYLNIDLSLFVAGGVVVSMVIAFAAQETLSNFFSGIFILTDRPFKEGDTIILADGDWYEVRKIGLRSTRLFRYKDSCLITIPNNALAQDKIVNYTNPYDRCRIRMTVGVGYGSDVDKTKRIIGEVIQENPHIIKDDENLKPVVRFDEMGESSINFFVQVIVDDRDNKPGVLDFLNTELYRRFAEEGIEIPFPQRTVWLRKEEGDKND